MFRIVIAAIIMIVYICRGVSYGIYTIKEKNIVGGISLFVLILATTIIHVINSI